MKTSSIPPKINPAPVTVLPLLVSLANCQPVLGLPWRNVLRTAKRLGVPHVTSGRKWAIRYDLLLAALERGGVASADLENESAPVVIDCADPAEAVRQMLGKRRAAR